MCFGGRWRRCWECGGRRREERNGVPHAEDAKDAEVQIWKSVLPAAPFAFSV